MTRTTKEVILIIAAISAALDAAMGVLVAAPGDIVSQGVLITLLAVSAGLSAFTVFMARGALG